MVRIIANYVIEDNYTDSIMIIHNPTLPKQAIDFLGATGEAHEENGNGDHMNYGFKIVAAPNGKLYAQWANGDTPEKLDIEEPVAVGSTIVRIAGFGRDAREDLYIIRQMSEI